MSCIIGITGSQGSGKTTMLNALNVRNIPGIVVDTHSVSRSVQAQYSGLTLAEIVINPENVPLYQERIIKAKALHLANLIKLHGKEAIIFTDRSPIDFYAYAKLWLLKNQGHETWLSSYSELCKTDLLAYDHIILVPIRKFPFVAETSRGSQETQHAHHKLCKGFIRQQSCKISLLRPLALNDRVEFCINLAQTL